MPIHLLPPWWRSFCSSSRAFSAAMISSQRAERLDRLHLLGGEVELGDLAQPFLGDRHRVGAVIALDPLEDLGEDLVEAVEQAFVLHEGGAGEIIELLGLGRDHVGVERLEQGQMLLERGGDARGAQLVDEGEEHGPV